MAQAEPSLFSSEYPLLLSLPVLGTYALASYNEKQAKLRPIKALLRSLGGAQTAAERHDAVTRIQNYLLEKSPKQENVFNLIDANGLEAVLFLINKENLPQQTQGCVKTVMKIISQVCQKVQSASDFKRLEAVERVQKLGATQSILSILYRAQTYSLKAVAASTLSEITRCDTSEKVIVEDTPMVSDAARYMASSSKLEYLLDLIEDTETDPEICEAVVQTIANCSHYRKFSNSMAKLDAVPLLHSVLSSSSSSKLKSWAMVSVANIVALDNRGYVDVDYLLDNTEVQRYIDLLGQTKDTETKGAIMVFLVALIERSDLKKAVEMMVFPVLNNKNSQNNLFISLFSDNAIVSSSSKQLVGYLKMSPSKGHLIANMEERTKQKVQEENEKRRKMEMQQAMAQQLGMM